MFKLSQLLNIKTTTSTSAAPVALVIKRGVKPFCVVVDEIIGHQQVVIKKMGDEVGTIRGVSGVAILGDGCAALILDLNELIFRSNELGYAHKREAA